MTKPDTRQNPYEKSVGKSHARDKQEPRNERGRAERENEYSDHKRN
ncbi:MAG TPA: hypothetical protein PLO23_00125 [Alphaproteobacteria bacterium]|mgnify:CR=1 FL=1|nr:hypothetical protein [Alphaproteobacteria bacterium]